jgi:NAD+ synthase (glutamine-hydrolysing)
MQYLIYQSHHQLADFETIRKDILKILDQNSKTTGPKLIIGPELLLTGYPLQDLCLQKSFYEQYQEHLNLLEVTLLSMPENSQLGFLIGGLDYSFDQDNIPSKIFNCLFFATPGKKLEILYSKKLLPNYDIFDEKKYFTPGSQSGVWHWQGQSFALMICEDMWGTVLEKAQDPVLQLQGLAQSQGIKFTAIINCSASPFNTGKQLKRQSRAREISEYLNAPFIYVNRVGAEDEILFDGQSFVLDQNKTYVQLPRFKSETYLWNPEAKITSSLPTVKIETSSTTWNQLFQADLEEQAQRFHPSLRPWSDEECDEVLNALQFGFLEYAKKCGFKNFLVALSGGIDSGLVLSIIKLCLPPEQQVEAIFMPGLHSTELSMKLAQELCINLQIQLKHLPIKFLHTVNKNLFREHLGSELSGVADENLQSRLRGMLLYTRSNQTNAMVVNTSNKSEIAVGYSTQYGDSVGALSLIGDLYKTQVYQLCHYINKKFGALIPKEMIDRAPTAELRPNQTDEQSLLPYPTLDALLECMLSYRYGFKDLINLGFEEKSIIKIMNLYQRSEYKRRQFCPILKIRPKSFGFGYRVPICKNTKFYTIID